VIYIPQIHLSAHAFYWNFPYTRSEAVFHYRIVGTWDITYTCLQITS